MNGYNQGCPLTMFFWFEPNVDSERNNRTQIGARESALLVKRYKQKYVYYQSTGLQSK